MNDSTKNGGRFRLSTGSVLRACALVLGLASALAPGESRAAYWEYSLGFSFQRTNYSADSFAWVRRWGTSIGYNFSNHTALEVGYQDVYQRTFLQNAQETLLHDRIASLNVVLNVTPREALLRPYFKVGLGQLIRDVKSTYTSGVSVDQKLDQLSGILGMGVKWLVGGQVSLRAELGTYLDGAKISTWQDNVGFNIGFSIYF